MRVYVATTWARLAGLVDEGLPQGTDGFAMTHRLARALDAPAPMAASDEVLDELAEVVLAAAAEASLLLLSDDLAPRPVSDPAAELAPARRAVLALEVDASAVRGPDGPPEVVHPAAVVLPDGAAWSTVVSVLADDDRDAATVSHAVTLLDGAAGGPAETTALEAAVELLDEHALGWYDPTELR